MIPVRLEMKNFLPYRSPDPIYFDGVHLACLTGHNGAGKSSLLDAITWALWGKARARRDDELVHIGQQEMYVQLDFEQENVVYRVLRRRKSGKRGHGTLDLFVMQPDGDLRTINEPSMKGTQQRINAILRLDYETFTNSAFLQQGKADAFTTKTPAERKKILSDILGLELWAVYEERAKEKLRELEQSIASLEGILRDIDEELAREQQYKDNLKAAEAAQQAAQQAADEAQARLDEVQSVPAELKSVRAQVEGIKRRLSEYQNDQKSLAAQIAQHEQTIAQYQQLIDQSESIEQGYQTLQDARAADSELGSKLREMSDIERRYNELQQQISAARSQLEQEKRGFQTIIQDVERILADDVAEELVQVNVQITALEAQEAQREERQAQLAALREERSGLAATKKTLTEEGKDMNERIATLEQAEGAACPLCGQALTDEHREQVLADLIADRDRKRETYRQATERIKEIDGETKEHEHAIQAIGEALADLPRLRSRAGGLQQRVETASDARKRLAEAQAALETIEQTLQEGNFAQELRTQLAAVEAERAAIGYDPDAHEAAQSQLQQYQGYEKSYTLLEVARENLPREQDALDGARKRAERLQKTIQEEEAAAAEQESEIQRLTLLEQEYERRQSELAQLRIEASEANRKLGEARQELISLERRRERKQQITEQRKQQRQEHDIYAELRQAFGKNGVPLMLIESAIPELEQSSNKLLARMTDGRMHLRFSTQRAKASGSGTIETLDIEIADELGTRAYEMYSGGEAFRINFAVRVALSKLLARRAGAQLRTLFIDEGFGTQDDDGRNKLVEAITAIQQEFDLVLVITHIDELRDAFPVHIVVQKTGSGSRVQVR